jgi:hypothetical protein
MSHCNKSLPGESHAHANEEGACASHIPRIIVIFFIPRIVVIFFVHFVLIIEAMLRVEQLGAALHALLKQQLAFEMVR